MVGYKDGIFIFHLSFKCLDSSGDESGPRSRVSSDDIIFGKPSIVSNSKRSSFEKTTKYQRLCTIIEEFDF